jgi:anti-sigma B factor antagonist
MEISTSQFKHCDVVKVSGRLDSFTSPKLAEELDKIAAENRFKIILDFKDLEFLSSAGLRVLIANQKNCKRYNRGELVVASLSPAIQSVFELAGFHRIFKIFPDVLTAVGSF